MCVCVFFFFGLPISSFIPISAQRFSFYFCFCQRMPKGEIVRVSRLAQSKAIIKCMIVCENSPDVSNVVPGDG